MFCTGLRIQPGTTERSPASSIIELRSCGGRDRFHRYIRLTNTCRYLTKLCDQLVCLLSEKHSQATVWDDEEKDDDDVSTPPKESDNGDLHYIEVVKTDDEEENVVARPGFTVWVIMTYSFLTIDNMFLVR